MDAARQPLGICLQGDVLGRQRSLLAWLHPSREPSCRVHERLKSHKDFDDLFHHAGWAQMGRNPFGAMTPQEQAQLAVLAPHVFPDTRPKRHLATQWIGPCGHGKTTRLRAIESHLTHAHELSAHYVYVTPERTLHAVPQSDVLLIDEMDRMPRRHWRQLLQDGVPLFVATHRCLQRRLESYGYQVQTQTLSHSLTPNHLAAMLNRRIAYCQEGPFSAPEITDKHAGTLMRLFGNDIRSIEAALYEHVQATRTSHAERLRNVTL